MSTSIPLDDPSVDFLHELGSSMASADALHEVLARVVEFASALVKCDSCLIYVLEDEQLLLRASKNPHPDVVDRLKLQVGEGITGWVAEHREPVLDLWRAVFGPGTNIPQAARKVLSLIVKAAHGAGTRRSA